MIIDALSRKSSSEAGELAVRDLREGSYLILENMKFENRKTSAKTKKGKVASGLTPSTTES
jgi:3-phosphoglycerate kinase